jgi:hypothetical protein
VLWWHVDCGVQLWTLCSFVGGYQRLGGRHCLCLQGTQPRGPQVYIFTTVKTSYLSLWSDSHKILHLMGKCHTGNPKEIYIFYIVWFLNISESSMGDREVFSS